MTLFTSIIQVIFSKSSAKHIEVTQIHNIVYQSKFCSPDDFKHRDIHKQLLGIVLKL